MTSPTTAPAAGGKAMAPVAPQQREMSPRAKAEYEIQRLLDRSTSQIAHALPATLGVKPEAVVRAVLTEVRMSEYLAKCQPLSIVRCAIECAQLGLIPNRVTGHAYLVPYKDVCTVIVGYRGLIDLARRSGNISTFDVYAVHERDEFTYRLGDEPKIEHVPYQGTDDAGHLIACYAIVRLRDGGVQRLVMRTREIDAVRKRSRASSSGPWVTDYEEMAKKTVVRRIWKMLPVSVEALHLIERERVREEGDPEERKAAGMDPDTGADLPTYDVNPDTGEVSQPAPTQITGPAAATDAERADLVRTLVGLCTEHHAEAGDLWGGTPPYQQMGLDELRGHIEQIRKAAVKPAPAGKGGRS